jgi:hypothetical protein
MRLTFIYTSLALCALCPALPLPATTLHPRGILHRPCEAWLPTPGKSSFLRIPRPSPPPPAGPIRRANRFASRRARRVEVDFSHFSGAYQHQRDIEVHIRRYHDYLRTHPGVASPVRGAKLAVVHYRGLSRDWPVKDIVHVNVAHYAGPTNPDDPDSARGLHLGNKWMSTSVLRLPE